MKRKSELAMALDDMFCQDQKKRISAIKMLDIVASNLGPQRTREQLVPFLNQFHDDDPPILIALLQQVEKIKPYLGGPEYEKLLINPLIGFCSSDQMQVAQLATKILQTILSKAPSEYIDCIKKLAKLQMNVAKKSSIKLIVSGVQKLPHLESTFVEIFKTMVFHQKASIRILACKNLEALNKNLKNKDQILKILQIIYNDAQELPKLLTLETLISVYSHNSNFVMNKLKILVGIGKWRFDLKLCQFADVLSQKMNKSHFKVIMEPAFLGMMNSQDIQTKAKSCYALSAVSKNMTHEENAQKLYPILQSFSSHKSIQVKESFAKNIVSVFPHFGTDQVKQKLLSIVFDLIKANKLQISTGIIENFNSLTKQLKNHEKVEQFILKPLISQLTIEDWRLRVKMLTLLGNLAIKQDFIVPTMIDLLINGCTDRVQAIRCTATQILIEVINKNSQKWIMSSLMPKMSKIINSNNYLIRQKILVIIDKTANNVGRSVLSEYLHVVTTLLSDKTPNIRMLAMKVAGSKPILLDKKIETQLLKLKDDKDMEVRQTAKLVTA